VFGPLLATLASPAETEAGAAPMTTRIIPATGERLAVVGLGTSGVFDVGDDPARRAVLAQVLQTLAAGGGQAVDTASTYGSSEPVLGALLAQTGLRPKLFIATKLESYELNDRAMQAALKRLRTSQIDLMQLHNVADPNQSLAPLRRFKEQGLCRYVGITSTFHSDYGAVEAVLRREKPDFVQIDYAIDDRGAEARILPASAELGAAVLTALPLGRGRLFRAVHKRPLPAWAAEFDAATWAQFFLKFALGNETITAVIPGTSNPEHMADNLGAGRGRLPDADQRRRMVRFIESLA
jgi:aryl-alcohol dehydrogenase-like predicted oxidoreductase